MELTEAELAAKIEEAKAEATTELTKVATDGTTWTSVEAMAESARNADKKIGEVTSEKLKAEADLAKERAEHDESRKKLTVTPPTPTPTPPEETPEKVLGTMSEKEEATLNEMVKTDAVFKKGISEGGNKAMAEALVGLRKLEPSIAPDDPFSAYKKSVENPTATSLQTALEEAHKKLTKKSPTMTRRGTTPPPIDEGDDTAPKNRAGGGMAEYAAKSEKVLT